MIKKILIILIICISILSITSIIKIHNIQTNKYTLNNFNIIKPQKNDDVIGNIEIKSLDIKKELYNIESINNNVDKNITILKESVLPDKSDSIIFIAAHSGTSNISYFKDLNKLNIGEEIKLTLYNKEYKYIVKEKWEEKKNGYINVNKEKQNQLILTTCSPTNEKKQLIVNCIEKEPK